MITVTKKISLAYVGKGWENCYLEFKIPTVKEVQKSAKEKEDVESALKLIKTLFIGGLGLDENEKETKIESGDIDDLPITLVNKAFSELVEVNPNLPRT